jgi:hypothetical protein
MGSGPGFATYGTPVGPMVEIYVDEAWMDISPDVRYADKIRITGGRPDESSRAQQNTCSFTLNNRTGKYSPRNPMSPLYGKIGRNTAVRVSVDQEGTKRYRFHGEIVAWPQNWDLTGNDVWVPIEAAGVLRRLNQGASPLRSTLYRGLINETVNPVIAYWPCEDGEDSTFIASAVNGAKNMVISGTPDLASSTVFACSDALPTMGSASFKGTIPSYTVTGESQVRFLLAIPAGGATNGQIICSIATTGTARRWELYYVSAGSTVGLRAFDADNVSVGDLGAIGFTSLSGQLVRCSVELTQNGANVDTTVSMLYIGGNLENTNNPFNSVTVQRVSSVTMAPGKGLTTTVIGHVSFQIQTDSSFDLSDQTNAYNGETPRLRLARLCSEEGVSFVNITGGGAENVSMGPQGLKTLPDLLQECVDVHLGILYEPRDRFGLEYRTRLSLYNQSADITLSYTASDLFEVPIPVDDDQLSRNDITVSREGGSSARSVLESGPLSVLPPPSGIGKYDNALTLNVEDDDQLADQAGFRVHLGTVDEPRYPVITVHLKRSTFTASYALTADALSILPGDRVVITGPPVWLPAGDISQIVQGWTEWFDQFEHVISFNGSPESPWRIAVLDSASLGRADTEGSSLTGPITDVDTSMTVATSSGPVWVDSAAYASEFPFNVTVGGEVMSVTAITGTTSPQTFTVTRSVNGVVKNQLAGESVSLTQPMILSL